MKGAAFKIAVVGMLGGVGLVAILATGFGQDPHAVPSVLEGRPAPPFSLQALDGSSVSLQSLAGKPAVLNFWATWCYPCQAEHGLLQQAAQRYGDAVRFLGIIYQDDTAAVRAYLQRRPSRYAHLVDPDSRTAIDFGVAGVPESFVLDPNGRIVHKQAGVFTAADLDAHLARWRP